MSKSTVNSAHDGPGQTYPLRLGVDPLGLCTAIAAGRADRYFAAFKEMGFTHVDIQVEPITNSGDDNSRRMAEHILDIDKTMRQHGMTYTINVEPANFRLVAEITRGVDEFDHPGGLHRWDLRMEWLNPLLSPSPAHPQAFQGIVYDEAEHCQLCNNKYIDQRTMDVDKPFLVNTHGMSLETAYDELVLACRRLREQHYEGRVPLITEHIWPDLFHIFANAGWNITPKLMKEGFSSLSLSVAMGAALQYADRSRFWVSPDFWRKDKFPGHSPEEFRSALLMGYWVGAETVYVEEFKALAQPLDGKPDGEFTITEAGRVARDFAKEYVPSHPRPITWRDYRPRVAIVRLPDGGWGQSPPDPAWHEYPSRDRLLGNREHQLDKEASEWLYIWPILTHGVVRPGATTLWNKWVYPEDEKFDFFVPIDSVAVFDHLVNGPVLDSVECFVVCGHALSVETFQAIRTRVDKGATCIISSMLHKQHATGTLTGDWLVVDSFVDPRIAAKLAPFLGPPSVARFRFARHVVEFRKGKEPDRIEVNVTELK